MIDRSLHEPNSINTLVGKALLQMKFNVSILFTMETELHVDYMMDFKICVFFHQIQVGTIYLPSLLFSFMRISLV